MVGDDVTGGLGIEQCRDIHLVISGFLREYVK